VTGAGLLGAIQALCREPKAVGKVRRGPRGNLPARARCRRSWRRTRLMVGRRLSADGVGAVPPCPIISMACRKVPMS